MKSMGQNLRELCERVEDNENENNKKLQTDTAFVCPGPKKCEIAICLGCGNWCSNFPPTAEL